ncbi:NUDIX domain-containing protein [Kitasatospora sp. NPDC089913]|uniref:NUDIX domain-containing protein n=1 Tax=Kitasatospora sp. NPDC089913 TaxID=3364080 RepID=UPI00381C6254
MDTILASPPRRRSDHYALVRNVEGAVLMVATTYQRGLVLPGGSAESNELPHLAARRHVEIVTGLVLPLKDVVAVDHTEGNVFPERLTLVFDGGTATEDHEAAVMRHLLPDDVKSLFWVKGHDIPILMDPHYARLVEQALTAVDRRTVLPLLLGGMPAI